MNGIKENKLLVGLVMLILVTLLGFIPAAAVLDTRVNSVETATEKHDDRISNLEGDRAMLKQAGLDTQRRLKRIEDKLDALGDRLP